MGISPSQNWDFTIEKLGFPPWNMLHRWKMGSEPQLFKKPPTATPSLPSSPSWWLSNKKCAITWYNPNKPWYYCSPSWDVGMMGLWLWWLLVSTLSGVKHPCASFIMIYVYILIKKINIIYIYACIYNNINIIEYLFIYLTYTLLMVFVFGLVQDGTSVKARTCAVETMAVLAWNGRLSCKIPHQNGLRHHHLVVIFLTK